LYYLLELLIQFDLTSVFVYKLHLVCESFNIWQVAANVLAKKNIKLNAMYFLEILFSANSTIYLI